MKKFLCVFLCAFTVTLLGSMQLFAFETPPRNEVVFGDQSWTSIRFHHRVMAYLLQHGYGLEPRFTEMDPVPSLIALRRGENHIIMEIWTETRQDWWNTTRRSGRVRDFGITFPNAPTGLYVPTYLIKGDPERGIPPRAPDLASIFDLPKYKHLFPDPEDPSKGVIYNAVPGWRAHERYTKKIRGYRLGEELLENFFNLHSPPSQEALTEAIRKAYQEGRGIVAYYWEPSALLGELDMTLLEEPTYDEKVFLETGLCQHPSFTVEKAAYAPWVEEHPQAANILQNYYMSTETMQEILLWIHKNGDDPAKGAVWFLRNHPSLWKSWIQDPEAIQRVEKALKTTL